MDYTQIQPPAVALTTGAHRRWWAGRRPELRADAVRLQGMIDAGRSLYIRWVNAGKPEKLEDFGLFHGLNGRCAVACLRLYLAERAGLFFVERQDRPMSLAEARFVAGLDLTWPEMAEGSNAKDAKAGG